MLEGFFPIGEADTNDVIAVRKGITEFGLPYEQEPAISRHLWALSRLGARELLYGPADWVIPPAEVSEWIEQLVSYAWSNPNIAGRTVSQLARKTGDRSRDLDEKMQAVVLEWMAKHDMSKNRRQRVREIVPLAHQDQDAMFGESLPQGIILRR